MNYDSVTLKGKYYLKYMVQCKRNENAEKGTIQELYKQSQSLEIIRTVEVAQLCCAGHLKRMGHSETPRSITDFRLEGRTVRRPKLWWMV